MGRPPEPVGRPRNGRPAPAVLRSGAPADGVVAARPGRRAHALILVAVFAALAALAVSLAWRRLRAPAAAGRGTATSLAEQGGDDEPFEPSPRTSPPRLRLRSPPSGGSEDEPSAATSAEDAHLRELPLQPCTAAAPPPAPPRTPVDPEPRAPDDPHDFDLPAPRAR
jgi:hypothetical protein